jgi:uncharacterized protein
VRLKDPVRRRLLALLMALASLLVAAAPSRSAVGDSFGPDALLPVPSPARVVDQAGVLAPSDRAALEARLARFESEHGAQVAIVIVPSTGAEPIEDFANRVGSTWKIGRHGVGDGLLLVVATQDRRARIEVARTLEGAIPDVIAKRVIQQKMGPHFKTGDYAGGLMAALDDLLPRIEQEKLGGPASDRPQAAPAHGIGGHPWLLLLVVGVVLGSILRQVLGAGGALVAGAGAGTLAAFVLSSVALGAGLGALVFLLAMLSGKSGRYGHAVGGLGGFPGSWGGGSWGGGSAGGGGFSSGGGGDFSGGGASGDW